MIIPDPSNITKVIGATITSAGGAVSLNSICSGLRQTNLADSLNKGEYNIVYNYCNASRNGILEYYSPWKNTNYINKYSKIYWTNEKYKRFDDIVQFKDVNFYDISKYYKDVQ